MLTIKVECKILQIMQKTTNNITLCKCTNLLTIHKNMRTKIFVNFKIFSFNNDKLYNRSFLFALEIVKKLIFQSNNKCKFLHVNKCSKSIIFFRKR